MSKASVFVLLSVAIVVCAHAWPRPSRHVRRNDSPDWACKIWFNVKEDTACCEVCDHCPDYTPCEDTTSENDVDKILKSRHTDTQQRELDEDVREVGVDRQARDECRVLTYEGVHKCCKRKNGCKCPSGIVATCWSESQEDDDW